MSKEEKRKARIEKYRNKYRLVILNDDTFEEKVSLKLSRLNVILVSSVTAVLLIILTILLIAFTPLREYIPGYASTEVKLQIHKQRVQIDSLTQVVGVYDQYYNNFIRIANGDSIEGTELPDTNVAAHPSDLSATISSADSSLRELVDEEDRFNLRAGDPDISTFTFYAPVKGLISGEFDPQSNHLAVDVVAPKNTAIKACLDGVIIISDWTVETGHVIVVQHSDNLISVYKHNSALLKSQGDVVQSGEAIAIIGNSGEQSTGPHLHFELWHNGIPVNPMNYISF
ncbi:MAG: M23 family metallopeptidase [Flavobacteriia bacterium]|nr:M23 family metallopeptidase [Flavobacteriia bacterium]